MHNLALIVAIAEQRRHQCSCGAVAEPLSGFCRKCQDRNAWRRKTTSTRRKAARRRRRRRLVHRVRNVARFLADLLNPLPTISNGMEG
jgi:hypothetical protein